VAITEAELFTGQTPSRSSNQWH